MTIDPADLDAFVGRFVTDLAAVAHAATVVIVRGSGRLALPNPLTILSGGALDAG